MKSFLASTALVAAVLGYAAPSPAYAWGETCKTDVVAEGESSRSEWAARESAIRAWSRATRRKYGRAYADWYYSGDRTFACRWKGEGRAAIYTCVARALPCGPR